MNKNEMVFKTIRMAETIEKHTWDRLPVWFTAPAGKIINRLILKIMGISEEQVAARYAIFAAARDKALHDAVWAEILKSKARAEQLEN
jgi:hypothetical protein